VGGIKGGIKGVRNLFGGGIKGVRNLFGVLD
jgi:hypothetical protein